MDIERRDFAAGNSAIEIRDASGPDKPATVVWYPIVTDTLSDPIPSRNSPPFRERVSPDAVRSALAGSPDVMGLVDHDPAKILGRTAAGTLRLSQDQRGLRAECELPDTSYARDLAVSIRRGDMRAGSFGFSVEPKGDEWRHEKIDGQLQPVRTIRSMRLVDVSVVSLPAYPDTSVALRSLEAANLGPLDAAGEEDDDGSDDEEPVEPRHGIGILRRRLALAEAEVRGSARDGGGKFASPASASAIAHVATGRAAMASSKANVTGDQADHAAAAKANNAAAAAHTTAAGYHQQAGNAAAAAAHSQQANQHATTAAMHSNAAGK